MQTIVVDEHIENAIALRARKAKEVHGRKVHAQQIGEHTGLLALQEMGVHGAHRHKSSADQIEVGESGLRKIGGDAEKTGESHEKHQVEVGKVLFGRVEPLQGGLHKVENGRIGLLAVHHVQEHFGQKEDDGGFGRYGV